MSEFMQSDAARRIATLSAVTALALAADGSVNSPEAHAWSDTGSCERTDYSKNFEIVPLESQTLEGTCILPGDVEVDNLRLSMRDGVVRYSGNVSGMQEGDNAPLISIDRRNRNGAWSSVASTPHELVLGDSDKEATDGTEATTYSFKAKLDLTDRQLRRVNNLKKSGAVLRVMGQKDNFTVCRAIGKAARQNIPTNCAPES